MIWVIFVFNQLRGASAKTDIVHTGLFEQNYAQSSPIQIEWKLIKARHTLNY